MSVLGAGVGYAISVVEVTPVSAERALTATCLRPVPGDFVQRQRLGPREVLAAAFDDISGDGIVDALFTSQLDERVLVIPGGRSAEFESGWDIPVGRSGSPAHAADVDGDGIKELLVAHRDAAAWTAYSVQSTALGRVVATWAQAPSTPQSWDVVRLANGNDAIVFAATRDGCILVREFDGNGLAPERCVWRSLQHQVIRVETAVNGDLVAAFADGDGVVLRLDGAGRNATETRRLQDGMTWQYPGYDIHVLRDGFSGWRIASTIGDTQCTGPRITNVPNDIGDWNADGLMDLVLAETCALCSSSLSIFVARPE
jgi:hypothetical protein